MGAKELCRHALLGGLIGLLISMFFHYIYWLVTGGTEGWYVKAILVALGTVGWLALRIAINRALAKEYDKTLEERRRSGFR